MKKNIMVMTVIQFAIFFVIFSPSIVHASENNAINNPKIESISVMPYADVIDWRYSTINGKLYKRLYNYSTKSWIGDWIPY